jgi:hypothetical protein
MFVVVYVHLLSCDVFFLADIHISLQRKQNNSTIEEEVQRAAYSGMFSSLLTHEAFTQPCFFLFTYSWVMSYTSHNPTHYDLPYLV